MPLERRLDSVGRFIKKNWKVLGILSLASKVLSVAFFASGGDFNFATHETDLWGADTLG